jgi:hypothetical protein
MGRGRGSFAVGCAVLLALISLVVGLRWGARAVGGADSYGYVSQADLWLEGRLVEPAPWIAQVPWPSAQLSFSRLGWVHRGREPIIVPQYAPGLPLVMAGAKAVAGHCAVFWIGPAAGAVIIFLTFQLGRRLVSSGAGLAAAWLVATSPAFVLAMLQPMSDVPVSAAWLMAYSALILRSTTGAALAGLSAAVAILIRPNLVPLMVPAAIWLLADRWQSATLSPRPQLLRAAVFAACALPGIVAVAVINALRYGSPFRSGYGPASLLYDWSHMVPNADRYVRWLVDANRCCRCWALRRSCSRFDRSGATTEHGCSLPRQASCCFFSASSTSLTSSSTTGPTFGSSCRRGRS